MPQPSLSVVVPAYNEAGNLPGLVDEVVAARRGHLDFELIVVDDHSTDDTLAVLQAAKARHPELRVLSHATQSGQSTGLRTGIRAARADWVATLDGDGQNDPADIPKLLEARAKADPRVRLFAGWRVSRRDDALKRVSSKVANAVRSRLLHDATPDTGCGLKLFERAFTKYPRDVPFNIILMPMEGDPHAPSAFWVAARATGGSFLSPSKDWP